MANATDTLELIGLTKEELQNRVVDGLVHKCLSMHSTEWDEECGGEYVQRYPTEFAKHLQKEVEKRILDRVKELGDAVVAPQIAEMVEAVCLQKTNEWGESKAEPLTFTEYLVERAKSYLSENVDHAGNTKPARFGRDNDGRTRASFLIERQLHESIATAMREAVAIANSSIVEGVEKAVQVAMADIKKRLSR